MFRRFTAYLTVLVLLGTTLIPLGAFAAPAGGNHKPRQRSARKLAPELETATTGTIRVIVQTKGGPSPSHDQAIAKMGGKKRKAFAQINALVADVPASSLSELAAREDVAYVAPDRRVSAQMDVTRETVGADLVQKGFVGNHG